MLQIDSVRTQAWCLRGDSIQDQERGQAVPGAHGGLISTGDFVVIFCYAQSFLQAFARSDSGQGHPKAVYLE